MKTNALKALRKIRDTLETGKQIASSFEPFNHGVSYRTVYDSGVRLAKIGIDHGLKRVFDWDNWKLFYYPAMIHDEIVAILKARVNNPIDTKEEKYLIGELYGKQFLVLRNRANEDFLYIPTEGGQDEYMRLLGRALWEKYGPRMLMETIHESEHKRTLKLSTDETKGFPSEVADNIYERLNKFISEGVNRSFMLYGPPGTGKTCLINYLVERFKKFSLTILPDETGYLRPADLNTVLSLLQPDFLIINDLDRFFGTFLLLTEVERFNNQIKLLAATVNNLGDLSKALIRPGRFDEIIDIQSLGLGVVDKLSAGWPVEVRKMTKNWPVAFIEELRLRTKILGEEAVLAEAQKLEERYLMNDEEEAQRREREKKRKQKKSKRLIKRSRGKTQEGKNAPDTSDVQKSSPKG